MCKVLGHGPRAVLLLRKVLGPRAPRAASPTSLEAGGPGPPGPLLTFWQVRKGQGPGPLARPGSLAGRPYTAGGRARVPSRGVRPDALSFRAPESPETHPLSYFERSGAIGPGPPRFAQGGDRGGREGRVPSLLWRRMLITYDINPKGPTARGRRAAPRGPRAPRGALSLRLPRAAGRSALWAF